jgi:hypothetical protein
VIENPQVADFSAVRGQQPEGLSLRGDKENLARSFAKVQKGVLVAETKRMSLRGDTVASRQCFDRDTKQRAAAVRVRDLGVTMGMMVSSSVKTRKQECGDYWNLPGQRVGSGSYITGPSRSKKGAVATFAAEELGACFPFLRLFDVSWSERSNKGDSS